MDRYSINWPYEQVDKDKEGDFVYYSDVADLESEVNRLQVALDATIAEKERCRHECQRAQSLAIENFNNWQKSATDFIDLVSVMEKDNAELNQGGNIITLSGESILHQAYQEWLNKEESK